MMKIYGNKRGSGMRCIWFMEELGIPYEIMPLDIAKGENKLPEYLKLNPNGKVPTLVDGDVAVWESLAINYYLMEKMEAFEYVGTTKEEHAQVNQWCLWSIIHLYEESFHALVMQMFRKTPDNEATKQSREVNLPRFLGVLDKHLADKEYLVLGKFTLADLTAMSVMISAAATNYDISMYKNIVRWMELIAERPAFKRVMVG